VFPKCINLVEQQRLKLQKDKLPQYAQAECKLQPLPWSSPALLSTDNGVKERKQSYSQNAPQLANQGPALHLSLPVCSLHQAGP